MNLGIVGDTAVDSTTSGFPAHTTTICLLRVSHFERDKLSMPMLLKRGEEPARQVGPWGDGRGETEYLKKLDWVEPDYSPRNNYLGLEPDVCLLIVEVKESVVPVKRLGVAYVRMLDFLIAGAEERKVLIG